MNTDGVHTAGSVLYIEDNLINTMLVERILQARPGVVFASAADGRTGLDHAERLRPDLVLLDLELPDIGGEQVLAGLRAGPVTRTIPVIVVSADIDPAVHHRILSAGARFVLTKPYDVSDLLRLVDGVLPRPVTPTDPDGLGSPAVDTGPQHGHADVVVRRSVPEYLADDRLRE
jgi:CheY-like chemotaxis protein